MSVLEAFKLKAGNTATNILFAYAKPGSVFVEGEIGLAEQLAAALLRKAGKEVTVEALDKIAAKVTELVEKQIKLVLEGKEAWFEIEALLKD